MYLLFILLNSSSGCFVFWVCSVFYQRELHILLFGLFKGAICLAVPVHLEIFLLCFSFCNIIENVVKKKKKIIIQPQNRPEPPRRGLRMTPNYLPVSEICARPQHNAGMENFLGGHIVIDEPTNEVAFLCGR
jgi:hypothetical protein